ncbi:uncharacterized protein [Primulina eburnea]|uniref:uncharacterized protein n=1 Tax=Primulina eburnea TaxID=1245227 RepID=UPI003C6C0FD9
MAFRAAGYWKLMANELRGSSSFTTSTSPKLKAYYVDSPHLVQSSPGFIKSKLPKGDFFPVCVALGMIALSTSFGVYTALHQLGRAPNVSVRKSRRETFPEVAEPEHVADDAEKFVKQSFFPEGGPYPALRSPRNLVESHRWRCFGQANAWGVNERCWTGSKALWIYGLLTSLFFSAILYIYL